MKKSILVSSVLAATILMATSSFAEAKPSCRPSELFGHVSNLVSLQVGRGTEPIIRSSGIDWPVGSGTPICAGDEVINPKESIWKIELLLWNSETASIEPGKNRTVPTDFVQSNLVRLFNRFLRQVNRPSTQTSGSRPVAPRGVGSCLFSPSDQVSLSEIAVKEWGPLFLTWSCGNDEMMVWNVNFWTASGEIVLNSLETRNFAMLDISKCDAGCMVTVSQFGVPNKMVLAAEIRLVSSVAANLPVEVTQLPNDSIKSAVIGGVLLRRPPNQRWHLQATSLLFGAGCDVPAAGALAQDVMGFSDVREPCSNTIIEQAR